MDIASEILDAIEIIVNQKIRENTAQIYPGVCKSVSGNTCVMSINGRNNIVQFYGSTPTVGSTYRVFVPNGNMSMAFIITGTQNESGGSVTPGVTSYKDLTDLPSINGITLQEGATSKTLGLYGTGNEPNYPVTKVNNKTGEVTLTADDVGALPLNTTIPKKTSELTNDSGFITLAQVPDSPVQSVNGKTGAIVLTATDVNALPSSTTIPTKTSQLTNDSQFITLAQVPAAPVQSVNGQTGEVVIDEYSLPTASNTVLGGIKVGSGLTINSDGVLSATGGGIADSVEWENVNNKPSTISGYGIKDAKITDGVVTLGDNSVAPILYTEQTLTAIQKQQARNNIDAVSVITSPTIPTSQKLGDYWYEVMS